MMKYRILNTTRNAGQYVGDQVASLSAAKAIVRASRPERGRIRWRQEGDDICAYAGVEDMENEDKAMARLRPVAKFEE